MLIDATVHLAIEHGAFSHPVNVAVDEHDEPYDGIDNCKRQVKNSQKWQNKVTLYIYISNI